MKRQNCEIQMDCKHRHSLLRPNSSLKYNSELKREYLKNMAPSVRTDYRGRLLVLSAVTLIVLINQVLPSSCRYIPDDNFGDSMDRRNDANSDDEEMDQNASAPYQQGGQGRGNGGDGYEENEPDGPYGETPREEEGQADMEKFFDDHLGASERDGMDKENLPTNLRPRVSPDDTRVIGFVDGGINEQMMIDRESPEGMMAAISREGGNVERGHDEDALASIPAPIVLPFAGSASQSNTNYLNYPSESQQDFEENYLSLPKKDTNLNANSSLISRRDDFDKDTLFDPDPDDIYRQNHQRQRQQNPKPINGLDTNGSDIISAEDEDMDRVYVTNMTDQPFKIDALGGYDPEEDFQAASKDIEAPAKFNQPLGNGKKGKNGEPVGKDISFNEPEDTLFNDASELDEVTFTQDDPYQTDLEAELQGRPAPHRKTEPTFESLDTDEFAPKPRPRADDDFDGPDEVSYKPRNDYEDDLSLEPRNDYEDEGEGNWVNDGVDDMEVPSQSYQDKVLEKAEKQEALAKQNAAADDRTNQPEEVVEDAENQRMPNGNYLNNDLKIEEDKA